jgi:hypothetical protein
MSSDAYIRIGSRGVRSFGRTEHHDSLVFADVPSGQQLTALRQASYALYQNAGTLLVRADSPVESRARGQRSRNGRLAELKTQIEALQLGSSVQWGLLHQPVGQPSWIEGFEPHPDDIIDRARAIELEALLDWGQAIWTPTTYHYRLPSGEHAAGFVRVADALQRPRDIEALASWLHGLLADKVGIVVDTGTLSGIVEALVAAIRSKKGWHPGPVNVLDGYPATSLDVTSAVRDTNQGSGVVALLSVNSSGRLRDHLVHALSTLPDGQTKALDVLVNKAEITSYLQHSEGVQVRTWHPRPSEEPLVQYKAENAGQCELCRSAKTATLISISPRSFDGSLPSALARITPKVEDARRNRRLWELADSVKSAIRLEADPTQVVSEWRPPGQMPFVFDYAKLLAKPAFRRDAIKSLLEDLRRRRADPGDADLVLMPDHEYALRGRAQLLKELHPILGRKFISGGFPVKGAWPQELLTKVHDARQCIAIVTLGAVTGTTLHTALSAVQGARDHGRYDLFAYVLHARLTDERAWQTLQNSYGSLLFAAWHCYLPERSPLRDEAKTLGELSDSAERGLSRAAMAFLKSRRELLSRRDLDRGVSLFWGTKPETELTPNSIFGQGLRAPATYAAVASAMERARRDQRSAIVPVRRVFEMPAILRSYYDPMILAAVLRWLHPHEAWWGVELDDEGVAIRALLTRATQAHRLILVPELLLAGAQGKLNRPGIMASQADASALLEEPGVEEADRGPIELALALVPDYSTSDAEQQLAQGVALTLEDANSSSELLELVPGMLRDLRAGRLALDVVSELENKIEKLGA